MLKFLLKTTSSPDFSLPHFLLFLYCNIFPYFYISISTQQSGSPWGLKSAFFQILQRREPELDPGVPSTRLQPPAGVNDFHLLVADQHLHITAGFQEFGELLPDFSDVRAFQAAHRSHHSMFSSGLLAVEHQT